MGTSETFGLTSLLHDAGHTLFIVLAVGAVLCLAFTVCSLLATARGQSENW
jgi:hypothetical protein